MYARSTVQANRTVNRKRAYLMTNWTQQNIHPSMQVFTLDGKELGHIAKTFQDSFLVHKGYFFPTDRYIPYSAIASIENDRVQLSMSADEAKQKEWEKRPDYEHHLGDPTQLLYDRGHDVHDPFEESTSDQA
jgi:hypothetical protein